MLLPPSDGSLVRSLNLSLADLLASDPSALTPSFPISTLDETVPVQMDHPIKHFYRTPNGRGLLAMTDSGEIGVWSKLQVGHTPKGLKSPKALLGKGHWTSSKKVLDCAIYAKGRAFILHTEDEGRAEISLQHLDDTASTPSPPIKFPDFELAEGDSLEMLMGVSDIDDGFLPKGRKTERAVVIVASQRGYAWIWRINSPKDHNSLPDITLLSKHRFKIGSGSRMDTPPHLILPVDPMGWHQSVIDWQTDTPLQDMVLTITEDGVLEFWTPRLGQHLAVLNGEPSESDQDFGTIRHPEAAWSRSGLVETKRSNVLMARCSSRKKTVLSTCGALKYVTGLIRQSARMLKDDMR